MAFYRFEVTKSMGGRYNRAKMRNTYNISANVVLRDEALRNNADYLVAQERKGLYNTVKVLQVKWKEIKVVNGVEVDKGFVRKIYNTAGLLVPTVDLVPLEVVVAVVRQGVSDRDGILMFRGALQENDLDATADGSYIVKAAGGGPAYAGISAMITGLNAGLPTGKFVFPPRLSDANSVSRDVTTHALGGVTFKQLTQSKTSPESDLVKAAKKTVARAERDVRRTLSGAQYDKTNPRHSSIIPHLAQTVADVLEAVPATQASKVILGTIWKLSGIKIPGLPE